MPRGEEVMAQAHHGREQAEDLSLERAIRQHIVDVYARTGGNISHAAALLGVSRLCLRRRLQQYGLLAMRRPRLVSETPTDSSPSC